MEKLHVGFMRDLMNIEFDGLYNDIIEVLERQQVDNVNIQLAFERIKPHVSKFNDALRNRTKNPHSVKNVALTSTRSEYLNSLRRRIDSYLLSHLPEQRIAAEYINFVLKEYDKTYYVPSIKPQSLFVSELLSHMKTDEVFRQSFEVLDLAGDNELMPAIAAISKEINKNYRQCIKDNIERKSKKDGVREAAYRDMKILINAIHFAHDCSNGDKEKLDEIEDLMWYVNSAFKRYRTPMKSRTTKRKNRREKLAAEEELEKEQQAEQQQQAEQAEQQTQNAQASHEDLPAESDDTKPISGDNYGEEDKDKDMENDEIES